MEILLSQREAQDDREIGKERKDLRAMLTN